MKLTKYIASAIAILAIVAGCAKEGQTVLSEVQVSSSYVAIPTDGGNASIDVTATDSWTIADLPEWLTVDKTSGAAGQSKVTFNAGATTATREAKLALKCAGKAQTIRVLQYAQKQELPLSTCLQVIQGKDGEVFRVEAPVSSYAEGDKKYGTFTINDGTGNVKCYDATVDGSTSWWGTVYDLEIGDVVIVEGKRLDYSGTIELDHPELIKVTKSLLWVDPKEHSVAKEGGEVEIKVVYKGNDLKVNPKEDWLSLGSINVASDTTIVCIKVAANEDDVRTGVVEFKSSIPNQNSSVEVVISQASGLSSYSLPYEEKFDASIGAWTISNVVLPEGLAYVWNWGGANYGMKASAFVNKVYYETESDLISPLLDLTSVTNASLTFDHVQRFAGNPFDELTLWASKDNGANWSPILIPEYTDGSNWNFITTSVSLTPFVGNQVLIKFKYKSYETVGATWEIKNVKVVGEEVAITNIAQLNSIAASDETEWVGNFTDAQVKYVSGNNVFIEDESAGTQLYMKNHGLKEGQVFNGLISGKVKLYHGYAELTSIDITKANVMEAEVEYSKIELADLLKSYLRFQNCMVKLEGVTIDKDLNKDNKNCTVTKGESSVAGYLQDANVTVAAGTGDLICFPTRYNANLQLGIWTPDHFVKK